MKTRAELELIKNFIDNTYSRLGGLVIVNQDKPFNPLNPELGYCFKYTSIDSGNVIYKIVCSKIGIDSTDFRVLMHEYGHIYLGHLDGIHEELDTRICNVFRDYRGELTERLNDLCGIDFADKLIERVIDDPVLNHSLHNIAMDMEVNSKILSKEDVEEIEKDVTSVLPRFEEEYLEFCKDHAQTEEQKEQIQKSIDRMKNETKIKLILPCRYYLSENEPFPDGLTYPEYLILIIKHLDQFVKMMVSIKNGGNGDTSNVTKQDVMDALGGGSGQGGSGNDGMSSLSELMDEMGMSASKSQNSGEDGKSGNGGSSNTDSPWKGVREGNGEGGSGSDSGKDEQGSGSSRDHGTESRDDADKKRELGQIRSGGSVGCSATGKADATRLVEDQDEVDMALDEVFLNLRSKVVRVDNKKDMLYLYNRGINKSVIAPTIRRKVTISTDPTIVYLIDISGSMDTKLVDRVLTTIANKMKKLGNGGLKYNIITWNTSLGEHIKDIDPRKRVPRISMGGGTSLARGIQYFKDNYNNDAILIIISDFEDYLEEWAKVEETMPDYQMYGFNYGYNSYESNFKNIKVRHFSND